jgi:DNA-binding MarR family transcriptional regulator
LTRKHNEQDIVDFVRAVGLLIRRVRAAASTEKLSLTEAMVMSRLAREGPATTADLARAEGMKPQSMRTTIATLEEMEMVERIPHPTDGRQVNIQLTARGISIRDSEKEAKQAWLNDALSTLSKEERDTLFAAGKIMKRLVDLDL